MKIIIFVIVLLPAVLCQTDTPSNEFYYYYNSFQNSFRDRINVVDQYLFANKNSSVFESWFEKIGYEASFYGVPSEVKRYVQQTKVNYSYVAKEVDETLEKAKGLIISDLSSLHDEVSNKFYSVYYDLFEIEEVLKELRCSPSQIHDFFYGFAWDIYAKAYNNLYDGSDRYTFIQYSGVIPVELVEVALNKIYREVYNVPDNNVALQKLEKLYLNPALKYIKNAVDDLVDYLITLNHDVIEAVYAETNQAFFKVYKSAVKFGAQCKYQTPPSTTEDYWNPTTNDWWN